MPTPHINAKPAAFSDICLMPGDPLRAKYIAENFLTKAKLVTDVRNIYGYTGEYKNRNISIMASGMGIPSASIYYQELITEYGVSKIIRIGSCGGLTPEIQLNDIIIAMGACTDSKVNRMRFNDYDFAAIANYELLESSVITARNKQLAIKVGNVFTSDFFYHPKSDFVDTLIKLNILGVEMETAGLYGVCARYGAKGLAICTVSDHINGDQLPSIDRQNSFNTMIELALDTALLH